MFLSICCISLTCQLYFSKVPSVFLKSGAQSGGFLADLNDLVLSRPENLCDGHNCEIQINFPFYSQQQNINIHLVFQLRLIPLKVLVNMDGATNGKVLLMNCDTKQFSFQSEHFSSLKKKLSENVEILK